MDIRTELLADHPECLAELDDLCGADEAVRECCHRSRLPIGVIAVDDEGLLCGAATLAHEPPGTRPPLGPWLTTLFVYPGRSGCGVDDALVMRIEQIARQLGFPAIYAGIRPSACSRPETYARLGWAQVQTVGEGGRPLTLFRRELSR